MHKKLFGMEIPVLVMVFVALILKVSSTPTCTRNQYKKINASGAYICDDCPKCPAGYGLLVQCGASIPANTRIKCQLCVNQANFSSEYDYEQCQSCGGCSKDQVMTSCTIDSNTICHQKCISKENYYEQSSDDCQECSWCCGDGNDIVQKECVKKGMPQQKSCTVHRRKECTPVVIATTTPTIKPNTVANSTTPTTPTQSTIGVNISSRLNATITIPVDGESKKKETNQSHNSNLTINIIFGCFVGILIVIAVIYYVIKRRINYNQGRLRMWVHFDNNYPIPQAVNELANNDALTEENSSVTQHLMVNLPADPTSSSSPAGPLSSMSPEENSMVDLPTTEQTSSASPAAESMQSSTSSPAGASSSSSPAGPSSSTSPAPSQNALAPLLSTARPFCRNK